LHVVEENFYAGEIQHVRVKLPDGSLIVEGVEGSDLSYSASLAYPDSLQLTQQGEELLLALEKGSMHDEIIFHLPAEIEFSVDTFQADVEIRGPVDQLDVRSSAGTITLNGFDGQGSFWAGRGDIVVNSGSGDLVLIGEHGILSVDNFDGVLSMSTIMGTLEYYGLENDMNTVALEVDHGPVRVVLPESANQSVSVTTTSGLVTCNGPGLSQTVDGCQGQLGLGSGKLIIRTVSGRVDLRVVSTAGE